MTEKCMKICSGNIKVVFFRFWKYPKHLAILILIQWLGKKYIGLCDYLVFSTLFLDNKEN